MTQQVVVKVDSFVTIDKILANESERRMLNSLKKNWNNHWNDSTVVNTQEDTTKGLIEVLEDINDDKKPVWSQCHQALPESTKKLKMLNISRYESSGFKIDSMLNSSQKTPDQRNTSKSRDPSQNFSVVITVTLYRSMLSLFLSQLDQKR